MGKIVLPQDCVYWYTLKEPTSRQLTANTCVDVAVIGGGIAGLSAAQRFRQEGLTVALLEKDFCGAGASGKSSGFISPDSELEAENFISRYGIDGAKKLWNFSLSGCQKIKDTIQKYSIACDYQEQGTLFITASNYYGFREITREQEARNKLNYANSFLEQPKLGTILHSPYYTAAISDESAYGIIAYLYCQGLKDALLNEGVAVYEQSPALSINDHTISTPQAQIKAQYIIVALDRFLPELQKFTTDIYHAQTFLLISQPLTDKQVFSIFPDKKYMITDTELVFNYFRIVENNRLLLGGGSMLSTYASHAQHNAQHIYRKLTRYIHKVFPDISFTFEYMWPGLLGISKDLMPLAQQDSTYSHLYYISAATGLSWGAALGNYSAEKLLHNRSDLDNYFSAKRDFGVPAPLQKVIGTQASFAFGNFLNKYIK